MKLYVSLPSGRCESFVVNQPAAVSDLKAAVCFLRLAAPNGTLLVQTDPVEICGLEMNSALLLLHCSRRSRQPLQRWLCGVLEAGEW